MRRPSARGRSSLAKTEAGGGEVGEIDVSLVARELIAQGEANLVPKHDFELGKVELGPKEDTFGLINDEIRARSPEQILADIEEVVVATDTMSTALEEVAVLMR